jgi:hypothetical protein
MTTWILIIWFATHGNYSYTPVVAGEYQTQSYCQHVANGWSKQETNYPRYDSYVYQINKLQPRAICLPKENKR